MKNTFRGLIMGLVATSCLVWCGCTKDNGGIYGTVTGANSGEPLQNVRIEMYFIGKSTITGYDGTYEFDNLDKDTYSFFCEINGRTVYRSGFIEVKNGEKVQHDIQIHNY